MPREEIPESLQPYIVDNFDEEVKQDEIPESLKPYVVDKFEDEIIPEQGALYQPQDSRDPFLNSIPPIVKSGVLGAATAIPDTAIAAVNLGKILYGHYYGEKPQYTEDLYSKASKYIDEKTAGTPIDTRELNPKTEMAARFIGGMLGFPAFWGFAKGAVSGAIKGSGATNKALEAAKGGFAQAAKNSAKYTTIPNVSAAGAAGAFQGSEWFDDESLIKFLATVGIASLGGHAMRKPADIIANNLGAMTKEYLLKNKNGLAKIQNLLEKDKGWQESLAIRALSEKDIPEIAIKAREKLPLELKNKIAEGKQITLQELEPYAKDIFSIYTKEMKKLGDKYNVDLTLPELLESRTLKGDADMLANSPEISTFDRLLESRRRAAEVGAKSFTEDANKIPIKPYEGLSVEDVHSLSTGDLLHKDVSETMKKLRDKRRNSWAEAEAKLIEPENPVVSLREYRKVLEKYANAKPLNSTEEEGVKYAAKNLKLLSKTQGDAYEMIRYANGDEVSPSVAKQIKQSMQNLIDEGNVAIPNVASLLSGYSSDIRDIGTKPYIKKIAIQLKKAILDDFDKATFSGADARDIKTLKSMRKGYLEDSKLIDEMSNSNTLKKIINFDNKQNFLHGEDVEKSILSKKGSVTELQEIWKALRHSENSEFVKQRIRNSYLDYAIEKASEKTPSGEIMLSKFIDSLPSRKVMDIVYGEKVAADLIRFKALLKKINRTQSVRGGSQTYERLAADSADELGNIASNIMHKKSFTKMALDKAKNIFGAKTRAANNYVNKENVERLLKLIANGNRATSSNWSYPAREAASYVLNNPD